jgi:hypothetical protein
VRWTVFVTVAAAFIFFACVPALAKNQVASPIFEIEPYRYPNQVFWTDDIEGDVSGWSTADFSASSTPHFHVDTYMAYAGSSWWCGGFAYDADGGYGNSWDDRLLVPVTDVSAATYPIFTYAFRHDSELGYDYTYVQAESLGSFVNLNRGYDGTAGWTDIGLYGFIMATYDNPFVARFRFVSDGGWSDEDGDYLSVGGGFMCDNIKIFDYFGGAVFFYDDVETGGLCTPSVPAAAGDYWHVIDRMCPALSDPHSWWCGDDADTGFVPALLQNGLYSPLVDLTGAYTCTVHFAMHFAIPTVDNDYVSTFGTTDGVNYYGLGGWWGDFGACDGWGGTAYNIGFDITQFDDPPYTWGGFLWVMYTTDNGCGPAGGGDAGAMIDDVWFEGLHEDPVERASWSRVKALYR